VPTLPGVSAPPEPHVLPETAREKHNEAMQNVTTHGPQTSEPSRNGRQPDDPAPWNPVHSGSNGGSYARLGEAITAAEIAHVITGKDCDELANEQWAKIIGFVAGKRLDQLSPQLQRLLLDCLLSTPCRNESDRDMLWTTVLSVEPDNKIDLSNEIRLLDSILTPESGLSSKKFCMFKSMVATEPSGGASPSRTRRYNTFSFPSSIVTRSEQYMLAEDSNALERIGSGEHSVVVRARRVSNGEFVAIKVIHPTAPPLSFFKEYLTHRRFTGDKNVLQAYEAGRYTAPVGDGYGTFFFMVLEYGDMTLAKLIEDRQSYSVGEQSLKQPFLPQEKRFFSAFLLSIVSALHRRRIIHRDIKPENIYLVVEGDVVVGMKVGDFGIARHIPAGSSKVVLGSFEGTPAYSPRTSIEKGEYDFYTDLFGYARTVACLEPGLFMTGIGQTTQEQIRGARDRSLPGRDQRGITTRSSNLVLAKRHMEKNLSSALFALADSGDPFVLFVILPILDPERYPYCPRVHEELTPMAAAAYEVQDSLDILAAGNPKEAQAKLMALESQHGRQPWYPIMSSDIAGLIRRCEQESVSST
jgi:serine/threonine protein kinase